MAEPVALISDIHANLEALEAVFRDIDERKIGRVICLGDIVGYGPDPEATVDLVRRRCDLTLMGNHDWAVLNAPIGFNAIAAGAVLCHRGRLMPQEGESDPEKQARWDFLDNLPEEASEGQNLFVHASPRDKIIEYILPADTLYHHDKLDEIFAMVPGACFVGHTHIPGVFTERYQFYSPEDIGMEYAFEPGKKAIVNVSSVGQPRDRDYRSCYAILTESGVTWRRLEYDVQTTIEKVKAIPCLDDRCGLRLAQGT